MNSMFEWSLGLRFLVALAVGFLIGLERESGRKERAQFFFGGVRTFPMVSVLGFSCAWLAAHGNPMMLPAGLVAVTALACVAYLEKIKAGRFGATSEVSALVTYAVGVLAATADVRFPIAIGVINTILLSEKTVLEKYVEQLDRTEFLATLKFLLVTVVIYPALPNVNYTAYDLNPARIWQIVVLVSAIGFVGYILSRKVGPGVGVPLSGLLGGIVSSTAVSVATGRLARERPEQAGAALQATLLASSVMFLRLIVLVAVFGGGLSPGLNWRLGLLCVTGLILALTVRKDPAGSGVPEALPSISNPVDIRVALLFALLFVGLKVATGVVHTQFGQLGVLGLGTVSGLVDVDPFVLSVAQGALSGRLAIQALLVAVMVNTLAKGLYFASISGRNRFPVLWRYGLWVACHVPLMWV
ncbi:MAG: MgtC/SapB family protein [bacterium]